MKVSDILTQVCSTRGTIAKTNILKEHIDNDNIHRVLFYGLNSFILFNVVKVPKVTHRLDFPLGEKESWGEFFRIAEMCSKREVTGNSAVDALQACFSSVTVEDEKWMRMILKKKLRLGIGTKTINKVFIGLIPTFEVSLAQQFDEKRIADMSKVYVEPKLDGIRCFAIVENNEAKLFARSGKLITNFDSTIGTALAGLGDGCYDGELMGEDFVALMRQAYRKDNADTESTYLSLFDYLSLEEWRSGDCCMSTKDRYTELQRRVSALNPWRNFREKTYVDVVVRHEVLANTKEIMALHNTFVQAGYEGAMVKTMDSSYQFGRSYDVMKVKEFHDVDLPIIGLEEGTGRHEGRLGAVKINFNGVIVKVGSGFSDEEREQVWDDQYNFLGRMIEVRYQEVTPDGSLRFPTFVCFRTDRDI
jgi:DNA ligase-1